MTLPTLICMARAPEHGRVKSRLARDLGSDDALLVYLELLRRSASVLRDWPAATRVFYAGNESVLQQSPLGTFDAQPQCGGNLGERLLHAAESCLPQGPVLFIGTDCPFLSVSALQALAGLLDSSDVAIGPSNDGGYWSIGLRDESSAAVCFASEMPWSQAELCEATQTALGTAGRSSVYGPELHDIDTLSDLQAAWEQGFPNMEHLHATHAGN